MPSSPATPAAPAVPALSATPSSPAAAPRSASRRLARAGWTLLVAGFAATLAAPAHALDIDLVYDAGSSVPPSGDPAAAFLIETMEAAAREWEAMFAGVSETVEVEFAWYDSGCGPSPTSACGGNSDLLVSWSPLTGTSYRVRMFSNRNWIFDDTPMRDEEWLDFHSTPKAAGGAAGAVYVGTWPAWAETTCRADLDWPPAGAWDLYSYALRSIGQVLVHVGGPPSSGSWLDVPSGWVGHSAATGTHGLRYAVGGGVTSRNWLKGTSVLSGDLIPKDERRHLAAPDVMFVATLNGWDPIGGDRPYLERTDLARRNGDPSTVVWTQPDSSLWFGNRDRAGDATAYVRDPEIDQVNVVGGITVGDLVIGDEDIIRSSDLLVSVPPGSSLTASGLELVRVPGWDVTLEARDAQITSGDAHVGRDTSLLLLDGSQVDLDGFTYVDVDGTFVVGGTAGSSASLNQSNGWFSNFGDITLSFVDAEVETLANSLWGRISGAETDLLVTTELLNDGVIAAENGVFFIQQADASVDVDLDLFEDIAMPPVLEAIWGTLRLDVDLVDDYDGLVEVGQRFEMIQPWEVGYYAKIAFETVDPMYDPIVVATDTVLGGDIAVTGTTFATWTGPIAANDDVTIDLLGSTSILVHDGTRHLDGTAVTGSGAFVAAGDTYIDGDTQVDVVRFVWDGELVGAGAPSWEIVVAAGVRFDVDPLYLSFDASDGYDGTITLEAGSTLDVSIDWQLDGTLDMDDAVVDGGTVSIESGATLSGRGVVSAPVVSAGSIVGPAPASGDTLVLSGGYTALAGATVSGNVVILP